MNTPTSKGFIIDGSERSVQDVMSKLLFISKIQEGQIMNVYNHTLFEASWYTSIVRTIFTRDETRGKTLEFFRRTLQDAFNILETCIEDRSKSNELFDPMIVKLIHSIEESMKGIGNHGKTYSTDTMHISMVEALLHTMIMKLTFIKNKVRKDFKVDIS